MRRLIRWLSGRIIGNGTGRGLWSKVLKRAIGSDKVIGLDPACTGDNMVQHTFSDWFDETGAQKRPTICLHLGCLAKARRASIWNIRYSTASSPMIRPSFTWGPVPVVPSAPRTSLTV